jgi:hypothetical protein
VKIAKIPNRIDRTIEFFRIYSLAQKRFGAGEPGWKFNVEARDLVGSDFPEVTCDADTRTVNVRLTKSTEAFPHQQTYQLAHELIHCLTPRGRRDTLWFEEGFANWHAVSFPQLPKSYRTETEKEIIDLLAAPYHSFLRLKPTAGKLLRLRNHRPVLDDVRADDIVTYFGASPQLADELCQRLPTDRPDRM